MHSKQRFNTSIGGQALIEGVMMRGPVHSAMATRLPDGIVDIEVWPFSTSQAWHHKLPIVRGMFHMVDSLSFGYKCLMKSAAKAGGNKKGPSKMEVWLYRVMGKNAVSLLSGLTLAVSVALAISLFTILPAFLAGLLGSSYASPIARSLVEGVLKVVIFVLYLTLVSRLSDISRVFEYHGAEHKTIACYEAGLELTVENVRIQSRYHPRCGTSFLLIVMVVSILLFSVVTWSSLLMRVLLKLLLLPVVIGVAYELIKYAGRNDNPVTRFFSTPGLWLQRLTTREPDDSQIEVAIESMLPVIPKKEGTDIW